MPMMTPRSSIGAVSDFSDRNSTTLPAAVCGNSQVEEGEDCDDGNPPWAPGVACRECSLLDCGDSDDSGAKTATDALFALRAEFGGDGFAGFLAALSDGYPPAS